MTVVKKEYAIGTTNEECQLVVAGTICRVGITSGFDSKVALGFGQDSAFWSGVSEIAASSLESVDVYVGTFNGLTNGAEYKLYKNGVLQNSTTGSYFSHVTATCVVLNQRYISASGDNYNKNPVLLGAIWKEILSPSKIAELSSDVGRPWSLFAPLPA